MKIAIFAALFVCSLTTQAFGKSPEVSSVYATTSNGSNASGIFTPGDDIRIIVEFSSPVNLIGTPQLKLETGDVDRVSETSWLGGSGLAIVFQYIVRQGDVNKDLDYVSTSALLLNGAQITDLNGDPVVLQLPAPGTSGSLSYNNDIVIGMLP